MHLQTSQQPALKLGLGGWPCKRETHVYGLYDTDAQRDEIVMGFLYQGDLDGDLDTRLAKNAPQFLRHD